jgi:hypothetical protein
MADVARHERFGASRKRYLEKRTVGFIRSFGSDGSCRNALTLCFEEIQEIRDVGSIQAELRPSKNGPVLGQDAVVGEKSDLAGQEQVKDATGIAFRIQQARHEDVRVEDDSQPERRRRRASRISRLIPAMESLLKPVSAAFLRMRDTARIALALRMAATVSSSRVSSIPTRTPIGFPLEVRTTSSFESVDQRRPGLFRSSRTLTYLTGRV